MATPLIYLGNKHITMNTLGSIKIKKAYLGSTPIKNYADPINLMTSPDYMFSAICCEGWETWNYNTWTKHTPSVNTNPTNLTPTMYLASRLNTSASDPQANVYHKTVLTLNNTFSGKDYQTVTINGQWFVHTVQSSYYGVRLAFQLIDNSGNVIDQQVQEYNDWQSPAPHVWNFNVVLNIPDNDTQYKVRIVHTNGGYIGVTDTDLNIYSASINER